MSISDYDIWLEMCRQEEKEYEKRMKVLEQKRQEAKMRRIAAQRAYDEEVQKGAEMRQLRTSLSKDWREFPEDMLVAVFDPDGFPVVIPKSQVSLVLGSRRMNPYAGKGRESVQVYAVYHVHDCDYALVPVLDGEIWHWEKLTEWGTRTWIPG